MKFSEYQYERIDFDSEIAALNDLLDQLQNADDPDEFVDIFMQINAKNAHRQSMACVAFIRHSCNSNDPFYKQEKEYWDEYGPRYEVYNTRLNQICVGYSRKEEVYDRIPKTFFLLAEKEMKCFDESIIDLLQKENTVSSEYEMIRANAHIECLGQTYNLSTIRSLMDSSDRETRKAAHDAKWKFYADHEADFDRIYDNLVKIRTEIAHKLGFENFTELGYCRMGRLDYDQKMVGRYREEVLRDIVPLASKQYKKQAERLHEEYLPYYDFDMMFETGNPAPKGQLDQLIQAAIDMYDEMSPETSQFIHEMADGECWDLASRDGKQMGGYTESIPELGLGFIFSNSNGTAGDVDTLTHEAGHSFMYHQARKNIQVEKVIWPTMESCEIHSMSMEFLTWPWMNKFFKEDTAKFKYAHLNGAISFLPYGILVDHFQHEVYNHPEMTPDERKACWRKLEKMYQPAKNYDGCEILEKGTWWYQQGHIFEAPFYYIDYTLAQVCALQFWTRFMKNDPDTWKDYLHLCQIGGSKTFIELCTEANLRVPFEAGCLHDVRVEAEKYLDSINDKIL